MGVIQTMKKELCNVRGLSEAKVEKIVEAAQKIENSNLFMTGTQALNKRKNVIKISSGSQALDKMLHGGFESMSITENIDIENMQVCYIDTENTFRPEKLAGIAKRFGLDPKAVSDNVTYAKAYNSGQWVQVADRWKFRIRGLLRRDLTRALCRPSADNQYEILKKVCQLMVAAPYSLLIVDSIMALFRVDYCGRGELSERQQKLGKTMSFLMKIAQQFNVAVVVTNVSSHLVRQPVIPQDDRLV
uniref:RecA family profile 1 domain-containing protein n=1 Tax=Chromera velia CCMP2878 TaxID=1169474 RepID=A0A0G4GKD0_9ALVE|eukprot:Cvel_22302.t1-p1 / transcript=Cvel_22302.t1 / gene=Cvel_22302 / organism=Chromera_velia_CCMP2878 / gene_product=Meiotic recombination protein DMC1 homolog, putative / transcript_product=Meiotic recombination protein DMC1 homolog, putative / location=Cvel_scaffold2178:29603-30618(-) / protein_length=244 / sequence_SO=supercontig / SO=protein_coding / is_pseudo=false